MRTVGTWAALVAGVWLSPALVQAQILIQAADDIQVQAVSRPTVPIIRGFGPFGGKFGMLQNKMIQDDLKLSQEQLAKIKDLVSKQQQLFKDFQKNPKNPQELGGKLAELNQANEKAMDALLQEEQVKRLKQISVQQQSERAFSNPEVATALKLSDEQKKLIGDILQDAFKAQRDISTKAAAAGNFQEIQKQLAEQRQATIEVIVAVLNQEQKQTWKELVGAPFKGQLLFGFGAGGIVIPQPPLGPGAQPRIIAVPKN